MQGDQSFHFPQTARVLLCNMLAEHRLIYSVVMFQKNELKDFEHLLYQECIWLIQTKSSIVL